MVRLLLALLLQGVPEDGRIVLTDYDYRDWGPELVHYAVDTKRFIPGKLVLTGPDGKAVPFQIDDGILTFVASLPKGGASLHTLAASGRDRSAENTTLKVKKDAQRIEISNEHLAVKLPAPGRKDAAPPLLEWSVGGAWMGGARFAGGRKIRTHAFRIVREGPAVVEAEARYRFDPKGEYVWRIRLSPGMPLAVVSEEFDFGEITKGEDVLLLELHKGWEPKGLGWVGNAGEQQMPKLESSSYAGAVGSAREVGGDDPKPMPWVPEKGLRLLGSVVPGGKWGGFQGGVQVWEGDPGTGRSIGLVPLFLGSWRRTMVLSTWHAKGAGVTVALPLGVRRLTWPVDATDDVSPFSTHRHDQGLRETYGRREWGLFTGKGMEEAQARFGHIGLDRYKDWILDWPDTAGSKAYPGAFFSPGHVARIKASLDRHPDAETLKTWYLVGGKTEDAVRHAKLVIEGLKKPYQENDFFLVGLSNYRKSHNLIFANRAEDALACPDLPADLRKELRLRLALYACVTSEPDWNPRGAGVHLGNNTMDTNRTPALAYFAGLLPDHPRTPYWLENLKGYVRRELGQHIAACGATVTCPTYHLYGFTRFFNVAENIFRNRGIWDASESGHSGKVMLHFADLTVPDPRFGGMRIIPGMGNSANRQEDAWGFSMAAVADRHPEVAGRFRYFHRLSQGGKPFGQISSNWEDRQDVPYPLFLLSDIPENREPLKTVFYPTYGVVFRSHFETPGETSMHLRAGMSHEHWGPSDYLNVILYAGRAPLSPGTGYQYYNGAAYGDGGMGHNAVEVGRKEIGEVFGRVDTTVRDYGFGGEADYAVAEHPYPAQIFDDGKGGMAWRRHVLFLKSRDPMGPNYFVMRDTFPGGEGRDKWWHWTNLDGPERISVDGKSFDPASAPVEKRLPDGQLARLKGRAVELGTDFGASTWIGFPAEREVRVGFVMEYDRQDGKPGKEKKTILEAPAGKGEDFRYVVYPRKGAEKPPVVTEIAPGAFRIETTESTDHVFVGDKPFAFKQGGVEFTGRAGAVRVFKDRVVLCMNAGSGRIGYKDCVFEGHGPFERTVEGPGEHKIDGGFEKKRKKVDLGRGVEVRGEGPFEARLEGDEIRIKVGGRARAIHVTQPKFILRPELWIDGQEWMACWTDYPSSGWGAYDDAWLIGFSVPEGEHELVLRNMTFEPVWERTFLPRIEGALLKD